MVGIYRLTMKSGSDNFRCSAIFDVMEQLRQAGVPMLLYEPALTPGQTVDAAAGRMTWRSSSPSHP